MRVINLILALTWCGGLAIADEAPPATIIQRSDPSLAPGQAEMGIRLYNLQRWDEALHYFNASYYNKPEPVILFDIAQCYRQLKRFSEAAHAYRSFLAQSTPDAVNRVLARRLAQDSEEAAQKAQQAQDAPPPTSLAATAWPASSEPVAAIPSIAVKPRVEARRPWYRSGLGWGLAAGGAAAVIAGGIVLGFATDAGQHAHAATSPADFYRWHQSDITYQQGGWPVLGVGVASIISGAIVMGVGR